MNQNLRATYWQRTLGAFKDGRIELRLRDGSTRTGVMEEVGPYMLKLRNADKGQPEQELIDYSELLECKGE